MKKLLLIFACIFSISMLHAQSGEKYYVYGVDFTQVKVCAAEESEEQFAQVFESINMLFIAEPEKYDCSDMLKCRTTIVIDPMMKLLSSCDYADLKVYSREFPEIDYAQCVKSYELPQTEGMGVVLIAKMLDKPNRLAIYNVVLFDIATREIIAQEEVAGYAGGFGLRNFWARSVYNVLQSTRYKKGRFVH